MFFYEIMDEFNINENYGINLDPSFFNPFVADILAYCDELFEKKNKKKILDVNKKYVFEYALRKSTGGEEKTPIEFTFKSVDFIEGNFDLKSANTSSSVFNNKSIKMSIDIGSKYGDLSYEDKTKKLKVILKHELTHVIQFYTQKRKHTSSFTFPDELFKDVKNEEIVLRLKNTAEDIIEKISDIFADDKMFLNNALLFKKELENKIRQNPNNSIAFLGGLLVKLDKENDIKKQLSILLSSLLNKSVNQSNEIAQSYMDANEFLSNSKNAPIVKQIIPHLYKLEDELNSSPQKWKSNILKQVEDFVADDNKLATYFKDPKEMESFISEISEQIQLDYDKGSFDDILDEFAEKKISKSEAASKILQKVLNEYDNLKTIYTSLAKDQNSKEKKRYLSKVSQKIMAVMDDFASMNNPSEI